MKHQQPDVPHCGPGAQPKPAASGRALAAAMNRACACFSVSRDQLLAALPEASLRAEHAHLIAGAPVFLGESETVALANFVRDAGAAMSRPAFRDAALAQSGATARHDPRTAGGILGFDFHLATDGPWLIEINTNPGGLLINAALQGALRACCAQAEQWLPPLPVAADIREQAFAVFEREWRQSGGDGAATVAIVDQAPASQYLSPEFQLFRDLFEERGWPALIADPAELAYRDGRLWHGGTAIDLVYNRLTDFALDEPAHAALRQAWLERKVVMSPHPPAHASWADKRLLAWLSDSARLQALGADARLADAVVARVPPTFIVRPEEAARWWKDRKHYYFKPSAGFGGKAAYAGDRLTRGTFDRLVSGGGYLAQATVPAPQRGSGPESSLKYDIRAYVDPQDFRVLLLAARLYRGQTTNFRTQGGGFAPVVVVPSTLRTPR